MSARLFVAVILAAVAIAIAGDYAARATMPAPKPDALAEPKSTHQTGFPDQLYKFSIPPDNPQTPAKIALGRMLYYDTRLSADRTVSCNSCHALDNYGVDHRSTSLGIKQQHGGRNAPTVYHAAGQIAQFWDGRAPTVEEQAKGPILNPVEMGMPSGAAVITRLRAVPAPRSAAPASQTCSSFTARSRTWSPRWWQRNLPASRTPF